ERPALETRPEEARVRRRLERAPRPVVGIRRQAGVGIAGIDHAVVIEVVFGALADVHGVGNAVAVAVLTLGHEGANRVLRRMELERIGLGAERGVGLGAVDRVDGAKRSGLMGRTASGEQRARACGKPQGSSARAHDAPHDAPGEATWGRAPYPWL